MQRPVTVRLARKIALTADAYSWLQPILSLLLPPLGAANAGTPDSGTRRSAPAHWDINLFVPPHHTVTLIIITVGTTPSPGQARGYVPS